MTSDSSAGARGTVVVSVDAELGWGHHDLSAPPRDRVEYARTGWVQLLDLFDTYDLPATWAVVGHLFLDDCDGSHADHPAPPEWFGRERGDWADRPDLRFGRGLVERVTDAAVDHELGCHTFSHVVFSDDSTTAALARAELAATETAADRAFDSFVFPRNGVAHRSALADAGYTCYRGPTPEYKPDAAAGSALKLARNVAATQPPVVHPRMDAYGLVNVPASLYLFEFEAAPRAVVEAVTGDPIVRRVRRGVDAVARDGGVFHLWLHPNNIRNDRHARRLHDVFALVAARRDAGDIDVEPMGAVADRVRERRGAARPQ